MSKLVAEPCIYCGSRRTINHLREVLEDDENRKRIGSLPQVNIGVSDMVRDSDKEYAEYRGCVEEDFPSSSQSENEVS